MHTRLMRQYNAIGTISLVYVSKPLTTEITAIKVSFFSYMRSWIHNNSTMLWGHFITI